MIVDSLDSLLVLGLEDEYSRTRDWVRDALDFDRDAEYNTFEVSPIVLTDGALWCRHPRNVRLLV